LAGQEKMSRKFATKAISKILVRVIFAKGTCPGHWNLGSPNRNWIWYP